MGEGGMANIESDAHLVRWELLYDTPQLIKVGPETSGVVLEHRTNADFAVHGRQLLELGDYRARLLVEWHLLIALKEPESIEFDIELFGCAQDAFGMRG